MIKNKITKKLILLILISSTLFLIGNSQFDLIDNSETHYTRVTQEMTNNKEYINLTFNGEPWFVHPPLYFWLTSLTTKYLGWSNVVIRLQSSLFSTGIVFLTCLIASLYLNASIALIAAGLLASSIYIIAIAKLGIFDAHLNFFILLSLYFILSALKNPEKKQWKWILAGIVTSCGILTKGPIALVQQLLYLVPWLIYSKKWTLLKSKYLWTGFFLSLLIPSPWYIHQLLTHGQPFFDIALKDYTWYRFFGVVENQDGDWYYYFLVLPAFYPWIAWFPIILISAIKEKITKKAHPQNPIIIFSWLVILMTFIFFSIAQTKLPNYIYLAFPFLSIIMAEWITKTKKIITLIWPLISIALIMITTGFLLEVYDLTPKDQALFQWIFIILSLPIIPFCITFLLQKKPFQSMLIYMICLLGSMAWLTNIVLPKIENYHDFNQVSKTIKSEKDSAYDIIHFKEFSPLLMVKLNKNIYHLNQQSQLNQLKNNKTPLYLLTIKKNSPDEWLKKQNITKTWTLKKNILYKINKNEQ